MNKLKSDMKDRHIEFLMTYADNLAIQYFKKQGFSDTIQIPKEIWKGYLKDYDGSTHMECLINPKIDYSEIASQIKAQKKVAAAHQCVIDIITKLVDNDKVYPPLSDDFYRRCDRDDEDLLSKRIIEIPGISSSTFTKEELELLK